MEREVRPGAMTIRMLEFGDHAAFGLSGPYRDWQGHGAIVLAMGGYTALMGDPGRAPLTLPGHYAEYQAAQSAYLASLGWRFQHYGKTIALRDSRNTDIHPRLRQIILPLLSIIRSEDVRTELTQFIASYHRDMVADRGMSMEADALAALLMCTHVGAQERVLGTVSGWPYGSTMKNDGARFGTCPRSFGTNSLTSSAITCTCSPCP